MGARTMTRKTILDDPTEMEDPTQESIDETAAEIAAATRMARAKKGAKGADPEKPTAAILPIYLREMGATPLIDENREVSLARELQEARQGLAKLALRLPATSRDYVLEGDLAGPKRGREWPLDKLESFYARLLRYAREQQRDSKVQAAVREARELKRHVDHARDALILANLRLVVHI